jgi:hypothetical protein
MATTNEDPLPYIGSQGGQPSLRGSPPLRPMGPYYLSVTKIILWFDLALCKALRENLL